MQDLTFEPEGCIHTVLGDFLAPRPSKGAGAGLKDFRPADVMAMATTSAGFLFWRIGP